jgi:tetratricopeptide repeat protein 8
VDITQIDMGRYARFPGLARILADYALFAERNPRRALELLLAAHQASSGADPWYKARIARCYFLLGLLTESHQFLTSALAACPSALGQQHLAKLAVRRDQPQAAIAACRAGLQQFPSDVSLHLMLGRVLESIGDLDGSRTAFLDAVRADVANTEAVSVLAASAFYEGDYDTALQHYRRLLQLHAADVTSLPLIWTNLALCLAQLGQDATAFTCWVRALDRLDLLASDAERADVWFNLGCHMLNLCDIGTAEQCFATALTLDPTHPESSTNLAVIRQREARALRAAAPGAAEDPGAAQAAVAARLFDAASVAAPHLYEPSLDAAQLFYDAGVTHESLERLNVTLAAFPECPTSISLRERLESDLRLNA